jgi:hypothetical protein
MDAELGGRYWDRTSDLLGVNELHGGLCPSLAQVTGPSRSDGVGAGRWGCCTFPLPSLGLALEDGSCRTYLERTSAYVGDHAPSPVGSRWSSMVIFGHFQGAHGTETEQVLDPSCSFDT